jgi:hypothetical protein
MRHNRVTSAVAGLLLAAGVGAGLVACSSGPSSPPTATQVLQSDGYTPSAAFTSSLQNGIGNSDGTITSSEAGTNGGNVQAVVVYDNASDASAGVSAVQSVVGGDGITVTSNGDVLTATGSLSAWAAAGADS